MKKRRTEKETDRKRDGQKRSRVRKERRVEKDGRKQMNRPVREMKNGAGKGFSASYTVEASYIMAIVFLSLGVLILAAHDRCREKTAVMRLHHISELVRGQAEENERDVVSGTWNGEAVRRGRKVRGVLDGEEPRLEIELRVHEPENMMRALTILDLLPGGE